MRGAPAWVAFGLIGGCIAFAATCAGNLVVLAPSIAQVCRVGVVLIPLGMLAAMVVFVVMALAAGLLSTRADGSLASARLAGLLVGLLSGAALPWIQFFLPALGRRIGQLSAACPQGGSISFGASPPPPEVAHAVNAIGASPPPAAFMPFGAPEPAGAVAGLLVTIAIGAGVAVAAAHLGGVIGVGRREASRAGRQASP
jgi:hypothetical protein